MCGIFYLWDGACIWSDVRSSSCLLRLSMLENYLPSGEAFDLDPENSESYILPFSFVLWDDWLFSSRRILFNQSFETFGFSFLRRLCPPELTVFRGGCFKLCSSFFANSAICLSSSWLSSGSALSSWKLLEPRVELKSELWPVYRYFFSLLDKSLFCAFLSFLTYSACWFLSPPANGALSDWSCYICVFATKQNFSCTKFAVFGSMVPLQNLQV